MNAVASVKKGLYNNKNSLKAKDALKMGFVTKCVNSLDI